MRLCRFFFYTSSSNKQVLRRQGIVLFHSKLFLYILLFCPLNLIYALHVLIGYYYCVRFFCFSFDTCFYTVLCTNYRGHLEILDLLSSLCIVARITMWSMGLSLFEVVDRNTFSSSTNWLKILILRNSQTSNLMAIRK